jgi:hypothetical protein
LSLRRRGVVCKDDRSRVTGTARKKERARYQKNRNIVTGGQELNVWKAGARCQEDRIKECYENRKEVSGVHLLSIKRTRSECRRHDVNAERTRSACIRRAGSEFQDDRNCTVSRTGTK